MLHGRHERRPERHLAAGPHERIHRETPARVLRRRTAAHGLPVVPRALLRRLRRAGSPHARHRVADGTSAALAYAGTERHTGRRAEHCLPHSRRARTAQPRPQRPALGARLRVETRQGIHHEVWQHCPADHRSHTARTAAAGEPGRRPLLRRTIVRHSGPAPGRGRKGSDERTGRRQADAPAQALLHLPAVAAQRALLHTARGRRPATTQARFLLR